MQKRLKNIKQTRKSISTKRSKAANKKRVFVGMSGGVDSSVAAALLQREGYDVVGVFMKVWEPDFLPCTWRAERLDAMRVAAHLRIPLLTWNFEKEYKEWVADYMIREYRAGRTPNPDVMCNREVKFGAFFDRAMKEGADFVATGHYARIARVKSGKSKVESGKAEYRMLKGVDATKDQSYFLWTLGQKQLSKTLFPVGGYKKSEIRKLAEKFGLPTAQKKDSQGICFVGQLDMKDFLAHFIKEKEGSVLNEKGERIGFHRGAYFYTLGERHGFTITQKGVREDAYYIIAKDIVKNTITVSHSLPASSPAKKKIVVLNNLNFCSGEVPDVRKKYTAQVRYHGEQYTCVIRTKDGSQIFLEFTMPVLVDAGQSVVISSGEECLGGGIVV